MSEQQRQRRRQRGGRRRAAGPALADFEKAARDWTRGDSLAVVTIGISSGGPIVVGMANAAGQHLTTIPTLADLLAAIVAANEEAQEGPAYDPTDTRPAPGDRGGWQ